MHWIDGLGSVRLGFEPRARFEAVVEPNGMCGRCFALGVRGIIDSCASVRIGEISRCFEPMVTSS